MIGMKKIFITGSGGFIGRNLVEQLHNEYDIAAPKSNVLDLRDANSVQEFLKDNMFDVVIHTANVNMTRHRDRTQYDALDGNVRMFLNLARCKDYYGKMYYFGSGAEYDADHYIPNMKEEYFDTHIPLSSYGFSKYIMSKYTEYFEDVYDLRLFGVYGKYEEYERRFISNAICRALKGKDITIQQNVYFDYLWIDDLVKIMKWFIEHEPLYKHYNICRGEKIDLYSLATMVKNVTAISCDITVFHEGLKPEYTGDNSRLINEIGQFAFTSYEESIEVLSNWYKANIQNIVETCL